MEQEELKKLVKKELLQSIWLEIEKSVSGISDLSRTQFGQEINGNHSWYSGALNEGEDIRLSSLVRIFGQLSEEIPEEERIPFERIFSEKVMVKGRLLSYLTSTKEDQSYLPEIIKQYEDIFKEVKNNLAPLYREGRLQTAQGYEEMTNILKEMESDKNG